MYLKQFIFGSILATVLFIALNIISSQLPWGVESVLSKDIPTHEIDALTQNQSQAMNLIRTKKSISFVASRPAAYYSMSRYFSINMVLMLFSAIFLCSLLQLIRNESMPTKLIIIGLFGLFSICSIHLTYWNWWGFSTLYSFGISLTTLFNLLLVSYVLARFIFKPIKKMEIAT